MSSETFTDRGLSITVNDRDQIYVEWQGKSTARDPGRFILPVLSRALGLADEQGKAVVLDFCKLEYMNSSTVTPLIRILDRAKRGNTLLTVVYNRALKWQMLNFTALEVFHTQDERIHIRGV